MQAPHWDAWSVENLPGLTDELKVAEMMRWWGRSIVGKQQDKRAAWLLDAEIT